MSTCKITRVSICMIRVRSESLADSIPWVKRKRVVILAYTPRDAAILMTSRRRRVAVAVLAGLASGVLLFGESLACSDGDRSAAQVVHELIRKSHVCRDGETGGTCRRLLARGTSIHAHGVGH